MRYIFLCLLSLNAMAQEASRTTLSVVGSNYTNERGYSVLQSVGQLSTIGFSEMMQQSIIQGYQQPTGYRTVDASVVKEILKIYPVPTVDELHLLFSMTMDGPCEVELFDRLGRLVVSEKLQISDFKTTISLKNLAGATYIIKVSNLNAVFYETIIKY